MVLIVLLFMVGIIKAGKFKIVGEFIGEIKEELFYPLISQFKRHGELLIISLKLCGKT
jgi:hypothetical protein